METECKTEQWKDNGRVKCLMRMTETISVDVFGVCRLSLRRDGVYAFPACLLIFCLLIFYYLSPAFSSSIMRPMYALQLSSVHWSTKAVLTPLKFQEEQPKQKTDGWPQDAVMAPGLDGDRSSLWKGTE